MIQSPIYLFSCFKCGIKGPKYLVQSHLIYFHSIKDICSIIKHKTSLRQPPAGDSAEDRWKVLIHAPSRPSLPGRDVCPWLCQSIPCAGDWEVLLRGPVGCTVCWNRERSLAVHVTCGWLNVDRCVLFPQQDRNEQLMRLIWTACVTLLPLQLNSFAVLICPQVNPAGKPRPDTGAVQQPRQRQCQMAF